MATKRAAKPKTSTRTRAARLQNGVVQEAAAAILYNKNRSWGSPPKYHPGFCHIAATTPVISDTGLAATFCVSHEALYKWCKTFPDFGEAVDSGRALADGEIEQALFHRAKGYRHKSEKIFYDKTDGIVRAPCIEKYPPSEKALGMWLHNRKPGVWRERNEAQGQAPDDAARKIRAQVSGIEAATDPDPAPDKEAGK